MLRQLDLRLFERLGAGYDAHPAWLPLALLTSRWSWAPMLALLLFMAHDSTDGWKTVTACLLTAALAQWGAKRLARYWRVHRPFTQGLSPNHLGHSLRCGFPSTHAVVMGFVTAFMATGLPEPVMVTALALLTAVTGWARVHAGAHFPLDVLAGWAMGAAAGLMAALGLIGLGLLPG